MPKPTFTRVACYSGQFPFACDGLPIPMCHFRHRGTGSGTGTVPSGVRTRVLEYTRVGIAIFPVHMPGGVLCVVVDDH